MRETAKTRNGDWRRNYKTRNIGKGETTKTRNSYSDGTSFIFYYHTMGI